VLWFEYPTVPTRRQYTIAEAMRDYANVVAALAAEG